MKEQLETGVLASYGAIRGIYSEFNQLPQADRAWLAIGAFVTAYEVLCKDGELLSEGVDRYLDKHPVITRAVIGATALHLANSIPDKYDPVHHLHTGVKKLMVK